MQKLLLSALLALAAPAPSDGFRDLLPELAALDHRDESGRHDRVDDARLAAIERRLEAFLDLPPELGIVLTDDGGGRIRQAYGLQFERFRARLWHRGLATRLCNVAFSLDGERVFVDGLCFLDPDGTSKDTQTRLRGRGHYFLSGLPLLFRGLVAELESIESVAGVKLALVSPSGGRHVHPGYATVRYGFYVGDGEVQRQLHVSAKVALTASPDGPDEPEGAAREAQASEHRTVEGRAVGPASEWRPLDEALAAGVEVIESFDLPGLERVLLRGSAAHWDEYQLDLHVGGTGDASPTVKATVWRDFNAPDRWRVMDSRRQLVEHAADLDTFLALLRRALELGGEERRSLGVFAVTGDPDTGRGVALVVTVPEGPVWDAQRGTLHVLRSEDGSAVAVVEETELRDFRIGRGLRARLDATSAEGHAFGFGCAVIVTDVGTELDEREIVRYRDLAAPLLGGSALRPPARK
jgi:hypothetical protein